MKVVTTINELRDHIKSIKSNHKSIGFVATMGALHKGHLSLMERAKKENDVLVTSIFVNPLQFGPEEDYEVYPRSIEKDRELAESQKTDILFAPSVDEMYPRSMVNEVNITSGTDVLCGKSRPGHFNGVATVVLKLFQLVQPDYAYFGQKDAQQAAIIKNMVNDFNIPVHVVACETMREEDGLAISSRNIYLTDKERRQSAFLYESLQRAMHQVKEGIIDPLVLQEEIHSYLKKHTDAEIDYVQILSFPELKEINTIAGQIIIAGALQFTKARLIDNILLHVNEMEGGNKYVSHHDEI
ncbi:pantoate--beta-alanine ligase [Alteribacillus bidgolensis]|uniref:Pantothenate synthetase n=1 Tax=Alteribacillus bidgolensis TaxID=930129 RepID=A0A1G8CAJ8_9BACI|nr:pantoate--beta-alanine ligase [Alteribacillus bidgolensis]SDH41900.1 pantoate--beta-alanine ligase [Alteribacillus bidgolensis]